MIKDWDRNNAVWDEDAIDVLSVGASQDRSVALLPNRVYYLNADVGLHFKLGTVAVAAVATSNYLPAGATVMIHTTSTLKWISVIRHTTDGLAYVMLPSAG